MRLDYKPCNHTMGYISDDGYFETVFANDLNLTFIITHDDFTGFDFCPYCGTNVRQHMNYSLLKQILNGYQPKVSELDDNNPPDDELIPGG